ncbi:hypothetical protein [Streptomyces albipurpureus]|uniref:Tetratricopeptide repeat protein n=1 Tax=Streptomyces albipurpureus TaxID=2897419 RepID=A0ABT0ULI8_9ACTN|nr:hypothetical protein [Streptomyces sp. CWNU-1]MCM2389236.1 hypothetical protein [Streptomyces sp. CWNU-1]
MADGGGEGQLVGRAELVARVMEALRGSPPLHNTRKRDGVMALGQIHAIRLMELYGQSGAGTSALARHLAALVGGDRAQPVHWLPVVGDDTEALLLRLSARLEVSPVAVQGVSPMDFTTGLESLCRQALARQPAVVVVDGVPPGRAGAALLKTLAAAVRSTRALVVATSVANHSPALEQLSAWQVPKLSAEHSADFLALSDADADPWHRACRGLPVLLRLAAGLLRDGPWEGPVPASPEELFTRVREALDPDATALLAAFAALDMAELPETMARALPLANVDGALGELVARGVLHRPRPGYLRLPALLREFTSTARGEGRAGRSRAELEAALAATANPSPLEPYVFLAARTLRSPDQQARECVSVVADALAQRNDLARLLLLSRLVGKERDLSLPLGVVARQIGDVRRATQLIVLAEDSGAARVELAELGRQKAQLNKVGWLLLPEAVDGRELRLLAAISLDQGKVDGAAKLLRRAIEAHQMAGDDSGEAWAAYEYGRFRLVVGDPDGAEGYLRSARRTFGRRGEMRGMAWADTGLAWALVLRGDPSRAVPALWRAVVGHQRAYDPRGESWALLQYALALADEGSTAAAISWLRVARGCFETAQDALGTAWVKHYQALLQPQGFPWVGELKQAAAEFRAAGCLGGLAWTQLEIGQRTSEPSLIAEARELFRSVGNEAGEHWADFATAVNSPSEQARTEALHELQRFYPAAQLPMGRVAQLPLAARYTVPEPGNSIGSPLLAPRPEQECRVRLAVLDGVYEGGTARISVSVEPGRTHPWTDADPHAVPLLSVSATVLGDAEIMPAESVTVWPTAGVSGGVGSSEFRLTPRRSGTLRLRFTVEDRGSGVVLQRVETEVEVLTPALVPSHQEG